MTKILLVEDDKSLREIYGVRLLAEGYDIVSAGDGEEALAMAIKERPQLIVSDVMMPKISGFDMLDILRSTTETREIKVIMMTALSSEDQRQRGEQLGADRYLVKSQVGIEDVVRTVHEVLGDAPVSQPSFSSSPAPQPTAAPAPVQPQSIAQETQAPQQQAAPAFAPQPPAPQPTAAPAPVQPQPIADVPEQQTPAPVADMPQPTAPFSSPRPATLGERVIQPVESTVTPEDMASRIAAELAGVDPAQQYQPTEPQSTQPPQGPVAQ
ncbi:MAG: PAS/PAC sensor hybrid histidine kinase [Candidatus Saccharibacteria bacterium GW2011_GWC2_48_9]|nr:MAG: PAS/PAC sensor hybrid histidine kinase [Candidatus Saccharibacteria bacterium GW2011_GWC2_48_9]HCH34475.1 hypothetical protein [Candidatus Saccharibacteria bacterium]